MNILLCCSAGMSTSLLVTKMEDAAKEQGIECKIWAESVDAINNLINEVDVLLIGPQVRYLLPSLKKLGEKHNFPVDAINPIHYGTVNGAEVLKAALNLVGK